MILRSCFVCDRPVLELEGQHLFFDSYRLTQADDEVLGAGAYGACHITCLLASRWGTFWGERLTKQHIHAVASETLGLSASHNLVCEETLVVRRDGLCCTVRGDDLRRLRPVEGGYVCQVTHAEYNLDLSDRGSLAEEIKAELLRQGSYPLPRLIDALGIGPTLFYPPALERGQVVLDQRQQRLASAQRPRRRKAPFWTKGYVVAGMVYDRFLPAEVVEVARAACPPG